MSVVAPPASAPRDLLLCLSHLRWDFVFQRPQHLLTRAARDFQVVYFEEPLFEEGVESELRIQWHGQVLVATPVLPPGAAEDAVEEHIDRLVSLFQPSRLLVWYYTPMALPLARHVPADCVVYDCMDELSLFKNAPAQLRQNERELLDACDLVFTGGVSLFEAKTGQHPDVHCFPSSIDHAHFAQARGPAPQPTEPEPDDQREIPHPRIGFFGVVDERLDIALLQALAAYRPDWHFVMLGPVVKIDPADLPQAPNIHWLGRKSYGELPDYLRHWDAGFMPFAMNDSTRFISPTKTPEFLAAGVPVVSTPIRDVVRSYGAENLVEIAAGPLDMAEALEKLLARKHDPAWLAAVDAKLAQSSWDATWQQMLRLIEPRLSRRSASPLQEERGLSHV